MEKLELKHLAKRLPYNLKVRRDYKNYRRNPKIETMEGLSSDTGMISFIDKDDDMDFRDFIDIKPILHPLSDLTKVIKHNGEEFVPVIELAKLYHVNIRYNVTHYLNPKEIERWFTVRCCVENDDTRYMDYSIRKENFNSNHYDVIQKLLEWHFVIDEPDGTWIDVNTLDVNPYE